MPQNRTKSIKEQITKTNVFNHPSTTCDCGYEMKRWKKGDSSKQQIEFPEIRPEIIEHPGQACKCSKCCKIHQGTSPEDIKKQSLIGPDLLKCIIALRFDVNVSIRKIELILKSHLGIELNISLLAQIINDSQPMPSPLMLKSRAKLEINQF
jgi:hypothetical protein